MLPGPTRIAIVGADGRMGTAVAQLAALDPALELVGTIGRAERPGEIPTVTADEAGSVLRLADVVIDFSAPELLDRLLREQGDLIAGRALVTGTTGLDGELRGRLESAARLGPVLHAANFSVGVNLLLALVEQAARTLGPAYDAEVVEAHHRRKVDAPSGTALALGEAIAAGRGAVLDQVRRDGRAGRPGARPEGEIGFHALRGGELVGEHRVLLIGERERVEFGHVAVDRALFAEGALRAAGWIVGRPPGWYTMRDVLAV